MEGPINYLTKIIIIQIINLDTGLASNTARNSSHRWAKIFQALDFYVDGTDEDGNDIFQPFISLQCRTVDSEHNKDNYYYYNNNDNMYRDPFFVDDGFYYTVHW